MSLPVKLRLGLDFALIVIFAITAYVSLDWQLSARIMPLTVSALGALLGIANLIFDLRRWRKIGFMFVNVDRGNIEDVADSPEEASRREGADIKRGTRYFLWIVAFSLVLWAAGSYVASAIFLFVFLRFEGRFSWRSTIIGVVGVLAAIYVADDLLNLTLPRSLLGW